MVTTVDTLMPDTLLLNLVSELTSVKRRREAARTLARHLGAEELIIFIEDPEIEVLLPAPGFPQTLPQGRTWRAFIGDCITKHYHTGSLPFPDADTIRPAHGFVGRDGSMMVLLGGAPNREEVEETCLFLPLLAAAFRGERAAEVAEGHAAMASQSAAQAKLLTETLDKARRDLQQALHARDQFLTIAAHELKTPLTSLLGYCQVLQRRLARETGMSERNQAALDTIYSQAQRLHKMVNQLFDLGRTQTGVLALEHEPFDLSLLCTRLVNELQPTLEKHKVELHAAEKLIVTADEVRIERVLQNLLDNAIKYSPDGGQIVVNVTSQNGFACIAVSDPGMGIPEEARKEMFNRYYRASNVNPRHISGLGIGLYIVDQIVASHGGKIEVSSEVGRGSTFTVCLPISA